MAGLQDAWGAWQNVHGDRSLAMVGKAIGQYDPYQDPKFYKDMQRFEQNPTAQNADLIIDEYGDQLDVEDYQDLASKIKPVEGTMASKKQNLTESQIESQQGYYNKLNDLGYGETKAKNEVTSSELGIAKNQQGLNMYDYMSENNYAENKVDSEISGFKANQAQNKLTQNKVEEMIEQGLPEQQIATEVAKLEAGEVESIYNKLLNQNKIGDADYLYELWKRQNIAGTEQAEAQATTSQVNANIAEATQDEQILSKKLAVDNQRMQNEQLETQLQYLDEQLQKELNAMELQNVNRRLQNELARMRNEKQRELTPLEIKQAKLNIKYQELNNAGQRINNQMAQKELDYLNSVGEDNLASVLGYETGGSSGTTSKFGPEDYVPDPTGTIEGGVAIVNDNNILLNPNTGKPLRHTNQEGVENYFVYDSSGVTYQLPTNTVATAGDDYYGEDNEVQGKWRKPWTWGQDSGNKTSKTTINNNQPNNNQQQTSNINSNSAISIIEGYKNEYNINDQQLLESLQNEMKNNQNFSQQFEQTYGISLDNVLDMLEMKMGRR